MAATLALIAAIFFALAATLEQKGTLNLPPVSLADPAVATVSVKSPVVAVAVVCLAREAAEPDPSVEPEAGLPAAPIHARDT